MARRKNTLTRFVEDLVDNTKDLVDDLLDRAKDVEEDLRDAASNVVDDDEDAKKSTSLSASNGVSKADIKAITAALAELTETVNALAEAQAAPAPRRATKSAP
ncbi:hypothetical protein, partial [Sporichthya sp.]|uniref:hypothetical protein n=1 Tax=Sporichthya sp. TaxID=65475 RepID=UPI00181F8C30